MPCDSALLTVEELNKLTRSTKKDAAEKGNAASFEEVRCLWERLLTTVHHSSVSDKHMTAACNAICFALRTHSSSSLPDIRSFIHSGQTWDQTFGSARAAFATGKNKPALQVLGTLEFLAVSSPDKAQVTQSVSAAAGAMVKIVFGQYPTKSLKEACIVLYFFIRKLSDFMSFSHVLDQVFRETSSSFIRHCHVAQIDWEVVAAAPESQWYAFTLALLMVMRITESKSATLKLLSLLCSYPSPPPQADLVGIVDRCIQLYSASDETALEDVSRDILPSILTSAEQFHVFLTRQARNVSTEAGVQVILALLQFGKTRAFITESDLPTVVHRILLGRGATPDGDDLYASFKLLLANTSPAIRLRSIELLTSSTSPKIPMPAAALNCLATSLPYLHDDTDAFHRGELLSFFGRFITRINKYHYAFHQTPAYAGELDQIEHFVDDFADFLSRELSPHLSYGRHILALDLINLMIKAWSNNHYTFPCSIFRRKSLLSSLWRLVLDPYDDVRSTAAQALSDWRERLWMHPSLPQIYSDVVHDVQPLSSATRIAAATNRADHADALGRVVDLMQFEENEPDKYLSMLVQRLCVFINSFVNTLEDFDVSTQYPLHGNVLGIAYIIRRRGSELSEAAAEALQDSLLGVCWAIWILSQPHLCIDSPEMETEVLDDSGSTGPKDHLAYAWRALRDSNLLMQAMLEAFASRLQLLKAVGDLCLDQLARLRHRGAFSTVAQTFLLCCQKARNSGDPTTQDLTKGWFEQAIAEIEKQADRLTRRSAGIPAMFSAMLDPQNREHFQTCFDRLVDVATQAEPDETAAMSEEKLQLPQVHGLNCLKDLMTSSRFRTMTEPLVVDTLNIAAQSMNSRIWAIKNCGLMLIRASINRLDPDTSLGAAEGAINIRTTSNSSHRPFDIAVLLLLRRANAENGASVFEDSAQMKIADEMSTEGEFAGLDLLGRLYIRKHERDLARRLVTNKLKHRLWHIRAQAARLLASMTMHEGCLSVFTNMLEQLETTADRNEAHGRLLVAQHLLVKLHDSVDWSDVAKLVIDALEKVSAFPIFSASTILAGMWFDLANQLLAANDTFELEAQRLCKAFEDNIQPHALTSQGHPSTALYDRAISIFLSHVGAFSDPAVFRNVQTVMADDSDVATYALKSSSGRYLRALTQVLASSRDLNVRATNMDIYVSSCRHSGFASSTETLQDLVGLLDFQSLLPKDLFRSQIVFYACLCRQTWNSPNARGATSQLKTLTPGFLIHLRAAANDEVDDATRRAASNALCQLKGTPDFLQMLVNFFSTSDRFEVLSVLYDLLNDDDDEIRADACESAAALIDPATSSTALGTSCAARSRQNVRDIMLRGLHQGENDLLEVECFRRLLGIKMMVSRNRLAAAVQTHLQTHAVKDQLVSLAATANDLFAEEKQNLYIDDLAEIEAWANTLSRSGNQKIQPLRSPVSTWVAAGLQSLQDILSSKSVETVLENSLDFEVLLIRVITIARVLGGFDEKLEEVQQKCQKTRLSQTVCEAFT